MLRAALTLAFLALAACSGTPEKAQPVASRSGLYPNETPELRALIERYSATYGVPVDLVQRVVIRESRHVPAARRLWPVQGAAAPSPQARSLARVRRPCHGRSLEAMVRGYQQLYSEARH